MKSYRYLLRAEAVFIHEFCDDTPDLSTARGGGLALLDSPRLIRRLLEETAPVTGDPSSPCQVSEITPGASVGMCELTIPANDPTEANAAAAAWRDAVSRALGDTPTAEDRDHDLRMALRHACFVLDAIPLDGGPAAETPIEAATAANRWRQLQQGSVRWREEPRDGSATGPCALDGVRPATVHRPGPDGAMRWLSSATDDRRHFGREARSDLYQTVSAFDTRRRFSQSLHELTLDPPNKRLQGKMAVVYADANGLSELVAPLRSVGARRAFDEGLRRQQGEMLARYLAGLEERLPPKQPILPIETLLWGGDEALWVLPAWEAWPFLRNLLSYPFSVVIPGQPESEPPVALSFGVGVVFCSHKAPIRRIKALARDLCEIAKKRGKQVTDRSTPAEGERRHYRSYVAYEVLESFDFLGMPATEFRRGRAAEGGVDVDQLLLPAETLASTLVALTTLRDAIPGSVLTRAARDRGPAGVAAREQAVQLLRGGQSAELDLEAVHRVFGDTLWWHLKDLHDYLPDVSPEAP